MSVRRYKGIAGVVIAGGSSRRMGRDKALIPFMDKPLIRHPLDLLSRFFDEVIVVANNGEGYAHLGFPVFPDRREERGALVGLLSGLAAVESPRAFFTACDMPFIAPGLIDLLVSEARPGIQAVVPEGPDGLEPLLAVYSRECLETMERLIDQGSLKITSLLAEVPTTIVPPVRVADVDPDYRSFVNLNSPDDIERVEAIMREEDRVV